MTTPLWQQFLVSGCATSLACVFTSPIEVVKTRLQLQGELEAISKTIPKYRNPFHAFQTILSEEGLFAIQKGLVTGVFYQFTMNGIRLTTYGRIKTLLGASSDSKTLDNQLRLIASGAISGALGALFGSPFFMLKVRFQSFSLPRVSSVSTDSPVKVIGAQHHYNGILNAYKDIWDKDGIKGLFRGADGAMLRVSVGSAAQLPSYDIAKNFLTINWNLTGDKLFLTSSLVASVAVTIAMNPFDVVSTRLYNQKVGKELLQQQQHMQPGQPIISSSLADRKQLYSGPVDCISKIMKTEGIRGFYKGVLAHYLRLGPHTILTFYIWEKLKKITGTN